MVKRQIIVLPADFQEVVIMKEMKFNAGDRNIELIRELLYLYSLGMEYYDSRNNSLLYSHYQSRNIGMLVNPEVEMVLDRNQGKARLSTIQVLDESPYKCVCTNSTDISVFKRNTLLTEGDIIQFYHSRMSLKKMKREEFRKGAVNEISFLQRKMNTIEEMMREDINDQKRNFEKRKLEKGRKKPRKSLRYMVRRSSKMDSALLAVIAQGNLNLDTVGENEILKELMELTDRKNKSNEKIMMKEVEEFVEKNTNEMQKSLDELRVSFEDEINSVDGEVFADVVKGLREDMEIELENLKEQYEEQRRDGVEKINAKYKR